MSQLSYPSIRHDVRKSSKSTYEVRTAYAHLVLFSNHVQCSEKSSLKNYLWKLVSIFKHCGWWWQFVFLERKSWLMIRRIRWTYSCEWCRATALCVKYLEVGKIASERNKNVRGVLIDRKILSKRSKYFSVHSHKMCRFVHFRCM